jgi:lipid-A-disaccharide synthase
LSIFVSCGEASGDAYGAGLLKALRDLGFDDRVWGMLGPKSQEAGGEALWPSSELSIVGAVEAVAALPRLLRLRGEIIKAALAEKPRAVVVIDSPDFHIPLLKRLKKSGFDAPIFYIAPPTIWAWRSGRANVLKALDARCFPLFEFEHDNLRSHGLKSLWVGHPLLDDFADYKPPQDLVSKLQGKDTVALLPGSRRSEVKRLLPVLEALVEPLEDLGYFPVFSVGPGLEEGSKSYLRRKLAGRRLYEGPGRDLIAASSCVVGASGTAAVEAMLLDRFMVVLYKSSWMNYALFKLLVDIKWLSIPNILAWEEIYPEFLQARARQELIISALKRYRNDAEAVHEKLARVRSLLGKQGAYRMWARAVAESASP